MVHLKTIKVHNPKVTLIQIPIRIAENWNLKVNDSVEVYEDEDKKTLIISARHGYIEVCAGSRFDKGSERVVNHSNVS